jgi:hypothetical protein
VNAKRQEVYSDFYQSHSPEKARTERCDPLLQPIAAEDFQKTRLLPVEPAIKAIKVSLAMMRQKLETGLSSAANASFTRRASDQSDQGQPGNDAPEA